MDKLFIKLFRDIRSSKGQFAAVVAVVFVGILVYSSMYMSYQNLRNSTDAYYETHRMAHVTFTLQGAPKGIVERVAKIEGIKMATGRLTADVSLDVPGRDERVFGRIVSLPDRREPVVNDVFLVTGGYFRNNIPGQALVEQQFAKYYGLSRGDNIYPVIDGKRYELKVIGEVGSPEYIYPMRSANEMMSALPGSFGIIYVSYSTAEDMLGNYGLYNEIAVYLSSPAQQDEIISKVKSVLRPYGIKDTVKRKDQLSDVVLNQELKELETLAVVFPVVFLSVGAMVMYILLLRMVKNQRGQIGILRAMGFSRHRIWFHYLLYSLLTGILGSVLGALAGFVLGRYITRMYTDWFNIPVLEIKIYWTALLFGTGLTTVFCFLAGVQATHGIMGLSPVEAMRPETPAGFKKPLLERWVLQRVNLSVPFKMVLRNLFRNVLRTVLTSVGIIMTVGLVVVSLFFYDALDFLLKEHFIRQQAYDMKVRFTRPLPVIVAAELGQIRGVDSSEPVLEIPVELQNGSRKEDVILTGLRPDTELYQFKSPDGRPVKLPAHGILISEQIAKKIKVKTGDYVQSKSLLGKEKKTAVRVAGVIEQYVGGGGYSTINQVGSLGGEGPAATGAVLKVEYRAEDGVRRELNESNLVSVVESTQSLLDTFKQYMGMFYAFIGVLITFSSVMGVAVIFNTTTVNILERQRELVSLRVMGFSFREVAGMVVLENIMLGVFALITGLPFGNLLSHWFVKALGNEMFSMPVVIYPRTYFVVAVLTMIIIMLALIPNLRYLKSLNLVEVIKTRD